MGGGGEVRDEVDPDDEFAHGAPDEGMGVGGDDDVGTRSVIAAVNTKYIGYVACLTFESRGARFYFC